MKRTLHPLILATALLSTGALAAAPAAAPRFRAGLWEVTTSSQGEHARSASRQRCYTPEQVKVANGSAAEVIAATKANAATLSLESKGCHVENIQVVGNQITEVVDCPALTLTDVTTYYPGDRFETDTTMTPKKKGAERKTHQSAHRIGDCTK